MLHTDEAESARAILNSLKPKKRAASVIDEGKDEPKTAQDIVAEKTAEVQAKLKLN